MLYDLTWSSHDVIQRSMVSHDVIRSHMEVTWFYIMSHELIAITHSPAGTWLLAYPVHAGGVDGVVGQLLDFNNDDHEVTEADTASFWPLLVTLGLKGEQDCKKNCKSIPMKC